MAHLTLRWVLAVLQIGGVISVVVGAAMMYVPAAFVLAGVAVALWAQGMQEAEDDEDTA